MLMNQPQAMNPNTIKLLPNGVIQKLGLWEWSLGLLCHAPEARLSSLCVALASVTVEFLALSLDSHRPTCQC